MFRTPRFIWLMLALVTVSSMAMVACGSGANETTGPAPAAVTESQTGSSVDAETLSTMVAEAGDAALKSQAQTATAQIASDTVQTSSGGVETAASEDAMESPSTVMTPEKPATDEAPAEIAVVETAPESERQADSVAVAPAPDAYALTAAHKEVLAGI